MRTELQNGYKLRFPDRACDYEITKLLGRGASCFVYLARFIENNIAHEVILKEYNPKSLELSRSDDGALHIPADKREKFNAGMSRFEQGYSQQANMRLNSDVTNATTNIQRIFNTNNTRYIEMTVSAGETYRIDGRPTDTTLYDFLRRMRSLATVIGYYHKTGHLHLDIKPDNVFAPKTTDSKEVILFDFDSMVKKCAVMESATPLSYTKEWAAMERINPSKRASICEATDIFSVGEMIFYRIFDRHSDLCERRSYSSYAFDHEAELFRNVNPKVFTGLNELLKKSICNVVKSRYDSTDELIKKLNELINLADPKEPYLVGSYVTPKEFFIGREQEISDIHKELQNSNILFLGGIGGIGKSELAKNYVKRYADEYDTVLFSIYNGDWMMLINDDSRIRIANFERFPDEKEPAYYRRKICTLKELCDERTLLIIDNLNEDEFESDAQLQWKDIRDLGCKLLITTRLRDWSDTILDVGVFSDPEHLAELFGKYCAVKNEEELSAVREIIEYVGGHTLTVELVAKQTKAGFSTPSKMLAKMQEHGISKSGQEKVASDKDNAQSRETTFDHIIALFDIAGLSEQERYVLANMSLIPPEGIEGKLFAEWCELENFDAVNSLMATGWLDRVDDVIKMHPIISEVCALLCLSEDPSQCELLLPKMLHHAIAVFTKEATIKCAHISMEKSVDCLKHVSDRLVQAELYSDKIAAFLDDVPYVLLHFGNIKESLAYRNQALLIRESLLGDEHPATAETLSKLGELYISIGNLQEAEKCLVRAFKIRCKVFGEASMDAVDSLYQLGTLYSKDNDINNAKEALELTLKVYRNNDEPAHIADNLNALGTLYESIGDYDKAEKCFLESLGIRKTHNNMRRHIGQSLNNLGELYSKKGDRVHAKEYLKQALVHNKNLYGDNHPTVADILNNIGVLNKELGDLDDAERCFLQALSIMQKTYGNEHQSVAVILNNLGNFYGIKAEYNTAKDYFERALAIYRQLFEDDYHSTVAIILNNLGAAYTELKNFQKAEKSLLDSLEIRRTVLGDEHPNIAYTISTLGNLYCAQSEYARAESCYKQALSLWKKCFGNQHPLVASATGNLGALYKERGDTALAKKYYSQAIKMFKSMYGEASEDVLMLQYDLQSM